MFDPVYEAQSALALRCLPSVGKHECFALKGGTAINLFLRDMPRLSVDIDLCYLPLSPRAEALPAIADALSAVAKDIETQVTGSSVRPANVAGTTGRLLVTGGGVQIKIEPNLVLRGSVYAPQTRDLSDAAQTHFEMFVSTPCLSEPDLYGGKICAALDRQHPRDLFDVRLILASGGLTPAARRAFVVYLAGHSRPMNELLNPQLQDLQDLYSSNFVGMSAEEVALDQLYETREDLISRILRELDPDERAFLLSMKRGEPEWGLLGIPHLERMPALQWKLINIRKMNPDKHAAALQALQRTLENDL